MTITQETLSWAFKDPEWKNKFIIGSALMLVSSLIPLIGLLGMLIVYGYGLVIMRAVMRGESPTLPTWERFGEMLVDGLKAILSALGYLVPGVLLFCCSYGFLFAMLFGGTALSSSSNRGAAVAFPFAFVLGEIGFFVAFGLAMTVSLLGMIPTPIAVAQYARTGEIGAGYRLREVGQILRANASGFLLAWVIYVGILYITSFSIYIAYATIILCFLLPVIMAPIGFYMSLIYAVTFGAAYREGIAKAGLATAS